jgi:hypothetical protein
MLDTFILKKISINVKSFVIQVAKRKHSTCSIFTSIQNHHNCTNCQKNAIDEKDGSRNFQMINIIESINIH